MLRAKVHVVLSLLSVLKIVTLMPKNGSALPRALPFKINVPENANTVNLKSASIVVIMLLHKGLTHIQSQVSLGYFLVSVSLKNPGSRHSHSELSGSFKTGFLEVCVSS